MAASKLELAGEQVQELAAAAESIDTSNALQGGTLGRAVPDRIAAVASSARVCQVLIATAEATCRERALIIAEYERQLELYEQAMRQFPADLAGWALDLGLAERGIGFDPGPAPLPPVAPVEPPSWADVGPRGER